jgi:probable rRNA maturation factor
LALLFIWSMRLETFPRKQPLVIVRKRVAGLSEIALARFVTRAGRAAHLRGVVNVLLTSNRELRALNNRFRGKDRPTDVLSFPPVVGLVNASAGDVAISAEMAAQNARLLGHSPAEEVKILALHGMLHLAGYDHERDQGEMARKEELLRKSLCLPSGLIDRSREPQVNGKRRKAPKNELERKFLVAKAAAKSRLKLVR